MLAKFASMAFTKLQLTKFAESTAASLDPGIVAREQPRAAALVALQKVPLESDVALQIQIAPLLQSYWATFKQGFESTRQKSGPTTLELDFPKLANSVQEWLGKQQDLEITLRYEPDAFLTTLVAREKSPAPVPASAGVSPDLARYLPPMQIRMLSTARSVQQTTGFTAALFDFLLKTNPEKVAALKANLDAQLKIATDMQQAAGFSVSAERVFQTVIVATSANAEAYRELVMQNTLLLRDPGPQANKTMSCTSQLQRAVRMVEGWPIDHLTTDCKRTASAGAALSKVMARLYPMTFDSVRVGSYVVLMQNGSVDEVERIAREILSGKPSGPPLAATAAFPESSLSWADFNLAAMLKSAGDLLPDSPGQPMRAVDPALPPMLYASSESDSATEYRIRMPKAVIAAAREIFERMTAAARPPAPPPPK
ncbi:MAG TPA: hypothetical protein VH083_11130 [Myxococcales bacterium]|jgi:hypothetical protein|nr:hypothetical protein [Myxococcales bacterium]